jgi:hypothetical protein
MRMDPALWVAAAIILSLAVGCRSSGEASLAATEPTIEAGGETVVIGMMAGSDDEVPVTVTADRETASFLLNDDFQVLSWNGEPVADRVFINDHYTVQVRFPTDTFEGDATIAAIKK